NGMTQKVCCPSRRPLNARPPHRTCDDHGNGRVSAEAAKRRTRAQEESLRRSRRATVLQVIDDRLTDFTTQWQSGLAAALAADVYPCGLPVDITQAHLHDVAGPQPQPGEEKQDRPIPLADGGGRITRLDDALDIPRR